MSFQQITLVARCIVRHKAKMLTGPRTQQKLKKMGANAQVQDQMLISRLGSLGIDVK